MIVTDFSYGKFSEVNHLNSNFRPEINKIKMTIDVISPLKVYKRIYPIVMRQFHDLFPNLQNHDCCREKASGIQEHRDSPEEFMNYALNILHLMEHVIIDIQCTITKMKKCSGITCNYHKPPNRFDIFVECIDKATGYSSASMVSELVQLLLNHNRYYGEEHQLSDFEHIITKKTADDAISHNSTLLHDYCSYIDQIMLNPQEFMKN